ncbi:MAG: lysoplasmalogenase [Stackebrandtia sp.]
MNPRVPAAAFGLLVAVNLLGTGLGNSILEWASKPLLMPALIWLVLARGVTEPRIRPLLLSGLAAATVADIALLVPGRNALLIGMGFFAVMQLCFITAYTRVTKVLARWRALPWLPALYLAVWLGFVVTLWTSFGELAVPIAGYGLLLAIMAAAAGTVSPLVGLGGGLFMVSDFMIGLGIADLDFPARNPAIMATYCAAQFLIVTGLAAPTAGRPAPGSTRPPAAAAQ